MSCTSISIALCTYNGERFLQEQLDSLAAQTRLPDEVVVGDDGSTDRTLEILEQWAEKAPFPVRIQKNVQNLGFSRNFEQTMLRCEGEILFLCDQDDIWLPNKLERMTEVFQNRPTVDLVYCRAETIDKNGQKLHFASSRMNFPFLVCTGLILRTPDWKKNQNMLGCCCAVRASRLKDVFPVPTGFGHDMTLYLRVPAFADLHTIRENLVHYRLHGENTSLRRDWHGPVEDFLEKMRSAYRWFPGLYFMLEKESLYVHGWPETLPEFLAWLDRVPDSHWKRRAVRYVKGNQKHYPNRDRVQRNFFVFFPLFFVEVFTGRYFARFQPVRSMAYDVWTGIKNGLNPLATMRLLGNLAGKLGRKLRCR